MDISKLPPITARDIEHLNGQDENIARRGTVAKTSSRPVPVHPGMLVRQVIGAQIGGLSHPLGDAPDASSRNPLDPTTPPKNLTPVKIAPGMKSRTSPGLNDDAHRELGARVLAEAMQKVGGRS